MQKRDVVNDAGLKLEEYRMTISTPGVFYKNNSSGNKNSVNGNLLANQRTI